MTPGQRMVGGTFTLHWNGIESKPLSDRSTAREIKAEMDRLVSLDVWRNRSRWRKFWDFLFRRKMKVGDYVEVDKVLGYPGYTMSFKGEPPTEHKGQAILL